MMGMRVSFDIDYSSLWRSGGPGRRLRVPLSRAPGFEDPHIDGAPGSSGITLPKPPANRWNPHAPVIAAGGMPWRSLAP